MGNSHSEEFKLDITLTDTEKRLLIKTWRAHIHEDDRIGFKVFDNLFTEAPEVKAGFSHFAEIDVHDEHYNDILHRHGSRVKHEVGTVIQMIQKNQNFEDHMRTLGCRHYKEYNFEPKYTQVIFEYFLLAIKETMGDAYSTETEVAYTKLFKIMSLLMMHSLATKKHSNQ